MPHLKPAISIGLYGIQDRDLFSQPGFTHDHSVCVMQEGQITHYLQLERLTRNKYDNQLHLHIESILDAGLLGNLSGADYGFVNSFVGNSFLSQKGRLRFEQLPRPSLTPDWVKGKGWYQKAPWGGEAISAYSLDHELAHVFTHLPFYGGFRDNSLLVHFDGGASLGNFSAFRFRDGKLEVLECHWNLSHLSKFFNDNALSFALLNHLPGEHLAVPGKLMGFATMGTATPALMDWLAAHGWFKDIWADASTFYLAASTDFGWHGRLGDTHDPFLQNVAACFQKQFETEWLAYLAQLQDRVKADFLYLSGGCALNIVANTLVAESGMFQDVFIPPCPGDSGLSIGAAAFMEWKKHGRVEIHSPYLNNVGLEAVSYDLDVELIRKVGDCIACGEIIGVANGSGEAGPRALGNRSILARPDSKALAQKVSMVCKGREWYRPIAPIMQEKHAKRLTGKTTIHHLSRFMLLDFPIPPKHQHEIEGVVHANGTARIQTLFSRSDNPFMWDLLSYLDREYQIPGLINTSFNHRGEPIVHTPDEAFASAKAMGLDGVVVNYQYFGIQSEKI